MKSSKKLPSPVPITNDPIQIEKNYLIQIEKVIFGGLGKGTIQGKTVLVEKALAGESLLVSIIKNKKKYALAKIISIQKRSPQRIQPLCDYFDRCGGCQYQQMTYHEELKYKYQQIQESFSIFSTQYPIHPIVFSTTPYHYRQRISLHQRRGEWGLMQNKKQHLPINKCIISHPQLQTVFQKKSLNYSQRETFQVANDLSIYSTKDHLIYPISIEKKVLYTHSRSFFQAHPDLLEKCHQVFKKYLTKTDILIDAYSGPGTFSFLLNGNYQHSYCLESSIYSFIAFNKNKSLHPQTPIEFVHKNINRTIQTFSFDSNLNNYVLILDPPRTGLSPEVLQWIKKKQKKFKSILYLSCHIATQVRDLHFILKNTKLKIKEVKPFDFFPRTKHIENLVVLS